VTTGEMKKWTDRLTSILGIKDESLRERRLVNMMDDLALVYSIPTLNNKAFNEANPFVIKLYRTVSEMRSL
jgi:hypothetical protein